MADKPLIADSKLSWIRDTTGSPAPTRREPDEPPKQQHGAGAKEHAAKTEPKPPRQAPAEQPPERTVSPEPPHVARRTAPQPERSTASQAFRPDMRQGGSQAGFHGFDQDMRQMSGYAPQPQGAPNIAPAPKKPGMIHYLLALVALICVTVAVPERYTVPIFLGFIFVILAEISYRLGQQYYLNRLNAENMNRILRSLDRDDRGNP